jgi:group I intron endonuclease
MKAYQPGVYCFWNKINNKVYVGSAQDLEVRINQHLKSKSSNIHLQRALAKYSFEALHISQVIAETHEDALDLEQKCLDYLFGKDLPRYNIADKAGGGCVGSKENHKELSEQGGGAKAKPFFIKEYPSGKILLEAESTYNEKAQKFLKLDHRRLSL